MKYFRLKKFKNLCKEIAKSCYKNLSDEYLGLCLDLIKGDDKSKLKALEKILQDSNIREKKEVWKKAEEAYILGYNIFDRESQINLKNILIPVGLTALISFIALGAQNYELKKIDGQITQTQKTCQQVIKKGKIKKLTKSLEDKIFYINDLHTLDPEIEPGSYSLSHFLSYNIFEFDMRQLLATKIKVKKRKKPLSVPLKKPILSAGYWVMRGKAKLGGRTVNLGRHYGQDYVSADSDTIYAAGDGVVTSVKNRYKINKSYGRYLIIGHVIGLSTLYAHCSKILVNRGDVVKKGQPIATIGETGKATSPHLHYEVRRNGTTVNPSRHTEKTDAPTERENLSNLYKLIEIDKLIELGNQKNKHSFYFL